jgi:hypothetical protein
MLGLLSVPIIMNNMTEIAGIKTGSNKVDFKEVFETGISIPRLC